MNRQDAAKWLQEHTATRFFVVDGDKFQGEALREKLDELKADAKPDDLTVVMVTQREPAKNAHNHNRAKQTGRGRR